LFEIFVHLVAYDDMGVSPIQTDTKSTIDRALTRVKIDNATAVLHIDDIRYAIRGTRVLWNAFMRGDKNPSRALGPGEFRSSW